MEKAIFENLNLIPDEEISILDKKGNTLYGTFYGYYDPKVPSFIFMLKDEITTVIYLDTVDKIFKKTNL